MKRSAAFCSVLNQDGFWPATLLRTLSTRSAPSPARADPSRRPSERHPGGRRRRLLAPDGHRRPAHGGAARRCPRGVPRRLHRTPGPRGRHGGRLGAAGLCQRRVGPALRAAGAAAAGGAGQPADRHAAAAVSHRRAPGRRDREGRRQRVRRRRQHRRPPAGAGRARRGVRLAVHPRHPGRQAGGALRGCGRAPAQERTDAGAGVAGAAAGQSSASPGRCIGVSPV